MFNQSSRKWFTLIEMLIVIVIIGILAAALIPRLTGIQARARDTARIADMRNTATALEVYYFDNGSYPTAEYVILSQTRPSLKHVFVPTTYAKYWPTTPSGSSLDTIVASLSSYMTTIPNDPYNLGVKVIENDGNCVTQGINYAYYTDTLWSLYAITSAKESKKGNASRCEGTIDRAGNGEYEKVGKGLTIAIVTPPPIGQPM